MEVDHAELLTLLERELDLDPGDLTETTTMAETEMWDSLAHLRLCMALEGEYAVTIPMELVGELTSVSAIISFLADAHE
jgi:acyl carrier protein